MLHDYWISGNSITCTQAGMLSWKTSISSLFLWTNQVRVDWGGVGQWQKMWNFIEPFQTRSNSAQLHRTDRQIPNSAIESQYFPSSQVEGWSMVGEKKLWTSVIQRKLLHVHIHAKSRWSCILPQIGKTLQRTWREKVQAHRHTLAQQPRLETEFNGFVLRFQHLPKINHRWPRRGRTRWEDSRAREQAKKGKKWGIAPPTAA